MEVLMRLTFFNSKLIALVLAALLSTPVLASIGTVTEQTGPDALLQRDKEKLIARKGVELEMQDKVETANTKLNLTFEDSTKVAVTEQSKFVIDEFIYDPNAKTGKLAMRVAMGTVRYASGGIAKNNRENVRLRTPTATISIRGTDFNMTVDEIGRSMIILLPSCPDFGLPKPGKEDECVVGEIMVSTDAGHVIMNQAFQATVVASSYQVPTEPRLVDSLIPLSNLLIISPPKEFPEGFNKEPEGETVSFLDADLLEFDELMKDLLVNDQLAYNELGRDYLGADFLDNLLNLGTGLDEDALAEVDGVLPTIHLYPWIKQQSFYNEEEINIYAERPPHIANVVTERDVNADVNITQDGVRANIIQNGGGDVIINITQTQ